MPLRLGGAVAISEMSAHTRAGETFYEILSQGHRCLAIWGCCDDDKHPSARVDVHEPRPVHLVDETIVKACLPSPDVPAVPLLVLFFFCDEWHQSYVQLVGA